MMKDIRKTNYTDSQLSNLVLLSNHSVELIGDYWLWSRNIGDTVEHVDIDFESRDKAFEYIYYNISLWKDELDKRIDDRLSAYAKEQKTNDITNAILNLRANGLNDITYDRITAYTGMSNRTVKRYISDIDKDTYIKKGKR